MARWYVANFLVSRDMAEHLEITNVNRVQIAEKAAATKIFYERYYNTVYNSAENSLSSPFAHKQTLMPSFPSKSSLLCRESFSVGSGLQYPSQREVNTMYIVFSYDSLTISKTIGHN